MKLNLFKKIKSEIKEVLAPQNTEEIIAAIHNEFDTAADRALSEAMFILSNDGMDSLKREKAALMEKFGFVSTSQVKEVNEKIRIDENAKKKAEIVNKYKEKYPKYKFIFRDQIQEICEKYGLVCGEGRLYKGDIPLKNLKEIEAFKIDDEDRYSLISYNYNSRPNVSIILLAEAGSNVLTNLNEQELKNTLHGYCSVELIPFFICAPKKDMNLENHKLNGVFATTPDPIVLHYVKDGFLIVTKWGIEGDDEMLK